MDEILIQYRFILAEGEQRAFDLKIDPQTMVLVNSRPSRLPAWTDLIFHQCPNCPLTPRTHPQCPLAINLVNVVSSSSKLASYDRIRVEVKTADRFTAQETSAQKGISSMMGLIIATSGCPHTAVFKPMARFHTPLASVEETVYRAASMYMLAQFYLIQEGMPADFKLEGLTNIYHNMQMINESIAARLRAGSQTDSSVNALILLDMYARHLPIVIEDSLRDLRYLFEPFFNAP
jgi:hypothetical protein